MTRDELRQIFAMGFDWYYHKHNITDPEERERAYHKIWHLWLIGDEETRPQSDWYTQAGYKPPQLIPGDWQDDPKLIAILDLNQPQITDPESRAWLRAFKMYSLSQLQSLIFAKVRENERVQNREGVPRKYQY